MEVVSKIINVMNAPTNPTITPTITQSTGTLDTTFTGGEHMILIHSSYFCKGRTRPLLFSFSHKVALILHYRKGM